jgi:hypothetical protein
MKTYILTSIAGVEVARILANISVTEEEVIEFADASSFSHTMELEIYLSRKDVRALEKLVEPKEYPSFKKQRPLPKFGGYMKRAQRQRW